MSILDKAWVMARGLLPKHELIGRRIASMLAKHYGEGLFYKGRSWMGRVGYFRYKLAQNYGEVSSWQVKLNYGENQ